MSAIYKTESYTIANNTSVSLDVDTAVQYFVFSGSATLSSGDYIITTASSLTDGKVFTLWWKARATYQSGNNVSIFGTELTQEQALSNLIIECKCTGTDVDLIITISETDPDTGKGLSDYAVVLSGETKTLNPVVDNKYLEVTGSGTLTGSTTITASTGKDGDEFLILYRGTLTLSSFAFSIFGLSLSADEAASGDLVVQAVYSTDSGTWKASMFKGKTLVPDKATQSQVETGTDNTTYTTPLRVSQKLAHWLANTNKSTSVTWTFSNATPINLSGLTGNRALEIDGSNNVISVAKADAYNKAFGTASETIMAGDDARVVNGEFHVYASFEAGKTGQIDFDIQKNMTLNSAYVRVTGTLAGTDPGTVTLYNGPSAITGGSQSIPASTAFGNFYNLTLSGPDADFIAGDNFRCTTAKTTSGGDILVIIYYTLT